MAALTTAQEDRLAALLAGHGRTDRPGVCVGILRSGRLAWARAYGMASLELGVALTTRTALRIGSVSKHFGVVAALLAEAEGLLSLDDDVRRHMPELPDYAALYGRPVTLRQLCDNTAGVCDFLELLNLSGTGLQRHAPSADSVEMIRRQPHLNGGPPGSRLVYSAGNFLILSKIVERVTGRSMVDLLEDRLFGPLGMRHTRLVITETEIFPGLASPYLEAAPGRYLRGGWGLEANAEGGIASSLQDMTLWADALLHDRIAPGLLARMAEPATYPGGTPGIYGLGLASASYRGLRTISHGGRSPGFRSELLMFPDQDAAIVVMSNSSGVVPYDLARQIADIVLEASLGDWPVPSVDLGPWAGGYLDEEAGEILTLEMEEGRGVLVTTSGRWRLVPTGEGTFRAMAPAWDFVLDPGPTPGAFTATDSAAPMAFRRLEPWHPSPAELAPLAGTWRNEPLATDYNVAVDAGGAHLRMQGERGFADYRLEPVAPGWLIARAVDPATSSHAPILRFETADSGARPDRLLVTTDRTKALRFERRAA